MRPTDYINFDSNTGIFFYEKLNDPLKLEPLVLQFKENYVLLEKSFDVSQNFIAHTIRFEQIKLNRLRQEIDRLQNYIALSFDYLSNLKDGLTSSFNSEQQILLNKILQGILDIKESRAEKEKNKKLENAKKFQQNLATQIGQISETRAPQLNQPTDKNNAQKTPPIDFQSIDSNSPPPLV